MAEEKKRTLTEEVISIDSPVKSSSTHSSWHSGSLKRHTVIRRLGLPTVAILVTTTFLSLLILGFLSFLWHGNSGSKLWHKIMINGWAARAVTIPTLLLRSTVDLQAGVAAAMIAALVLECGPVPIVDVAKWSVARGSKPKPRSLLLPSIRNRRFGGKPSLPILIILTLCVTTTTLQLSSTILLSDFDPGILRKFPAQSQLLYNYLFAVSGPWYTIPGGWALEVMIATHYPLMHRTTTWLRNPPMYPIFAEYYTPPKPQGQHVDDTGPLLRAFLPYADATLRQTVSEYTGKTLVMDSRVSCQPPELTDLAVDEVAFGIGAVRGYVSKNAFTALRINGTLRPSHRDLDRLWAPDLTIPFSCFAGVGSNNTAICQLNAPTEQGPNAWNQAGGLLSEFANVTNITELRHIAAMQADVSSHKYREWTQVGSPLYITWGTPLLVLQAVSQGSLNWYQDPFWNSTFFHGLKIPLSKATVHPTVSSDQNGPWALIKSNVDWHPWTLRASLCYTAWDAANLDVSMSSEKILTEPMQHWDPERGLYTTPSVTEQLLSNSTLSNPNRQILTLEEKDSWVPRREDVGPINAMPFIQAYADLSGNSLYPLTGMTGNYTAILTQDFGTKSIYMQELANVPEVEVADNTLAWLFDNFMENSNSIAHSVSALITVLSGMAYYDQLPRFQAETNATQTFFTEVLFPQHFGGFWTIFVTVMVHVTMITVVTAVFLGRSQVSFIGNHWHSVIQLGSSQTASLYEGNSVSTDGEMRKQFSASQTSDFAAQLMPMEDGQGAQVAIMRDLQGSSISHEECADHNCKPNVK